MEILNNPEPWWETQRGPMLGLVELIENGTLPAEAAAMLWWMVERGASYFVVAEPGSAGKTTLATALLSFLPEETRLYVMDGSRDRLDLPPADAPLYLLINELSNHTPRYVHGEAARRAFALLSNGYRMVGTLHAGSAAEALAIMVQESGIPITDATRIPLILVIRPGEQAEIQGWRLADGAERHLAQIALIQPNGNERGGEQEGGIRVLDLAAWDETTGTLASRLQAGGGAALAAWAGVSRATVQQEIAVRTAALAGLAQSGQRSAEALAAVVQNCRRASSPI